MILKNNIIIINIQWILISVVIMIFLNIYFLENNFAKDNKVTWLSKGERLYGKVISVNPKNNKIKVKPNKKKNI